MGAFEEALLAQWDSTATRGEKPVGDLGLV